MRSLVMKKIIIAILLLAAAGGFGGWYLYSADKQGINFRTVRVERGDLLATIGATGTIEPEEVIDVGAQVAGQIVSFGQDPRGNGKLIDYGSPVEKDTVLARIDESLYRAQLDRAKAQVTQAEANVQRAEADLGQMQAKLNQSERDWQRAQRLRPSGSIAEADYDLAEATYRTNKATLAVGQATVAQAKAALSDAQAALHNAEINLGYCTIKSPVKGAIVDRRVNVGQTVVASLNTPSLFLIAKDLKRMQVWASVNEADVGNIHSGQAVRFTVDAFPGEVFQGVVAPDQPRLNASMTQNVVTYTVVVNTDNSSGKLLPYLTANLQFEVGRHTNVLLVPNAALRWQPAAQQVAEDARADYLQSLRRQTGSPPLTQPSPGGRGLGEGAPPEKDYPDRGTVWVEDQGFVRPIHVRIVLSDGARTEVIGEGLKAGDPVVVGESRSEGGGGTSNPFAPQLF